jgi:hypothetical protein
MEQEEPWEPDYTELLVSLAFQDKGSRLYIEGSMEL